MHLLAVGLFGVDPFITHDLIYNDGVVHPVAGGDVVPVHSTIMAYF